MIVAFIFVFALVLLLIISNWTLYQKAGKPGWASIIPIYNIIVMLEIVKKPWWWIFLMMIPFLGLIWGLMTSYLFVKSFGKGVGFYIGCLFFPFIFYPILAFSSDIKFVGLEDDTNNTGTPPASPSV